MIHCVMYVICIEKIKFPTQVYRGYKNGRETRWDESAFLEAPSITSLSQFYERLDSQYTTMRTAMHDCSYENICPRRRRRHLVRLEKKMREAFSNDISFRSHLQLISILWDYHRWWSLDCDIYSYFFLDANTRNLDT